MEARGQPHSSFLKNNIFCFLKSWLFKNIRSSMGEFVWRSQDSSQELVLSLYPGTKDQTQVVRLAQQVFLQPSPSRDLIGHIFSYSFETESLWPGTCGASKAACQPVCQWTPENESASASSELEFQVCPHHTCFYLGLFGGHQTQVFTFTCMNCTLKTLFNHPRSIIHFLMKQTCKKAYLYSFPDVSAKIDTLP